MAKRLSANKRAVIEWLASSKFERVPSTQGALADQLGIHESTISRWKRSFIEEINHAARAKMREALPDVLTAMIEQAKAGSYQHQKLFLEMVGELKGEDAGAVQVLVTYGDSYARTHPASRSAADDSQPVA